MSWINRVTTLPVPVLNHWGYWLILFSAILEPTPVIGIFVPGQTIVILGGFFAKMGVLDIGDVIVLAAIGSMVGDLIGYLIGRRYGLPFLSRYARYFFFKKEYYAQTKKLMNSHTGKTLILGRFNSLTRAFSPFIAGLSKVRFPKFIFYNIIGGISWSISYAMIGYIFGHSYQIAAKYFGELSILVILIVVLVVYLYYLVRKRKKFFSKKQNRRRH